MKNLSKILLGVVGVVSVLAVALYAMLLMKDTVESSDIDLIYNLALVSFVVAALAMAIFSLKDAFLPSNIKGTAIGLGFIAIVLGVAYAMSSGNTFGYDITESTSKLVGAGIKASYGLGAVAILAILFSGVSKLTK